MATQTIAPRRKKGFYLSLRWQMLIMFGLLLSIGFFAAFYWFYTFASDQALNRIKSDLRETLEGGIAGINGDDFEQLAQLETSEAEPLDNPLYAAHQEWLKEIRRIEPRSLPYTFIPTGEGREVYWIGDIFRELPERQDDKTAFKDTYDSADSSLYDGLTETIIRTEHYTDQWGNWISAYGPIYNSQGEVVGGMGIDFDASHWFEVKEKVQQGIAVALIVGYISLAIFVMLLANFLTRPIRQLTLVAEEIGEGNYDQDMSALTDVRVSDEIDTLAGVIEIMVDKVAKREEKLKQQVAELQIMIDDTKRQEQVSEIVESDFFRELQVKAQQIRKDFKAAGTARTVDKSEAGEDAPAAEESKPEAE
jgi:HAMP domain-containing protein